MTVRGWRLPALDTLPRARLAVVPTPLHEAKRLREALGGPDACPRVFIKRDDLTGFAMGGNKVRKLEFLLGDALLRQATVLITCGAAQSNHARIAAAGAAAAGLKAVLVLTTSEVEPEYRGNLLLDRIFGAEISFVVGPGGKSLLSSEPVMEAMNDAADRLRARGERPYVIPLGGSNAIGIVGYVDATRELVSQLAELKLRPSRLYHASGSLGTAVGLALGAKIFDAPYQLVSVSVVGRDMEDKAAACRIAAEIAALLRFDGGLAESDLMTCEGYLGQGYGVPTPEGISMIELLARSEGVLLDPVYNGKAMAALVDDVRGGRVAPQDTVIFLHTGGAPAIFAYGDQLLDA